MKRVYNFSAGPAIMPVAVLEEAAKEMLSYKGCGSSVMELSHRSSEYKEIHEEAKNLLKELMNLDNKHEILFLQGGASSQFYMLPMNILNPDDRASYLITGSWAKKAYKEACYFGKIDILASSEDKNFSYIPKINEADIAQESKYLYLCTNNTIYGTRIDPKTIANLKTDLVADMSSNILSEEYDMNKFKLAFAGAQKNLGPSGLTIVVLDKEFIEKNEKDLPSMLNYKTHIDKDSMYNTPACYSIYMCGLVAKWIKKMGGVKEIEKLNRQKAELLYDFIDNSDLYKNTVVKEDRSLMNVVFVTGDKNLDKEFVAQAKKANIVNIKGHRSIGGMRASLYNAMPLEAVEYLINFMKDFEIQHR